MSKHSGGCSKSDLVRRVAHILLNGALDPEFVKRSGVREAAGMLLQAAKAIEAPGSHGAPS